MKWQEVLIHVCGVTGIAILAYTLGWLPLSGVLLLIWCGQMMQNHK